MKRIFIILCLITICNVSYADIASTGYVDSVVATKQDSIADIETIRSGAGLGATAVQPSSLSTVARSGSYNDLTNKPTIPNIPTGPNDGNKYTLVWDGKAGSFVFEEIPVLQCEFPMIDLGFKECVDFNTKAISSTSDNAARTWSVTFPYGTISGVSDCSRNDFCDCQMTSPRQGESEEVMLSGTKPCSDECSDRCVRYVKGYNVDFLGLQSGAPILGIPLNQDTCLSVKEGGWNGTRCYWND